MDIRERQDALTTLYNRLFPASAGAPPALRDNGPAAPALSLSDRQIVDRASTARNGAKFRRLWAGDTAGYGSHSEADLALCGLLAFYTGPDPRRLDRLFRQSGLMRDKWNREDYRRETLALALNRAAFWTPRRRAARRPPRLRVREVRCA